MVQDVLATGQFPVNHVCTQVEKRRKETRGHMREQWTGRPCRDKTASKLGSSAECHSQELGGNTQAEETRMTGTLLVRLFG